MQTVPHRASFNSHPLALLAASFACGVLLARFTQSQIGVFVACGAICSALAVVAFVRARACVATALVCAAFVCVGGGLAVAEREGVPRDRVQRFYEEGRLRSGDVVELTGVVRRAPEVAPDGGVTCCGSPPRRTWCWTEVLR